MKLESQQNAPLFITTDVSGKRIDLKGFRGKKVYLAFERNAGCPVCNLRVHELLKYADELVPASVMILVYESTLSKMKEYLGETNYPFHFIADPENKLYKLYSVERSWKSVLRSLVNGLFSKVRQGKKLFKKNVSQDGHPNTIPAEFIIDESGKIGKAHYGKFVGDHIPITELLRLIQSKTFSG